MGPNCGVRCGIVQYTHNKKTPVVSNDVAQFHISEIGILNPHARVAFDGLISHLLKEDLIGTSSKQLNEL